MADINKVICTGFIEREPTMVTLNNGNRIVLFTLKCTESWLDANKKPRHHINEISCEIFKKDPKWIKEKLKVGTRYLVEGFLRTDVITGNLRTRVRVFNVQPLSGRDKLEIAKAILDNSADLESARNKINLL